MLIPLSSPFVYIRSFISWKGYCLKHVMMMMPFQHSIQLALHTLWLMSSIVRHTKFYVSLRKKKMLLIKVQLLVDFKTHSDFRDVKM